MLQVFVSPGAIRFVATSSGNGSPASSATHVSTALSGVSQGTIAPSGPGRSRTTSDSTAWTERGAQPARSGMCSACMPRSPMQP
jgi:hypothetical protein